jgi:hypothetical protein
MKFILLWNYRKKFLVKFCRVLIIPIFYIYQCARRQRKTEICLLKTVAVYRTSDCKCNENNAEELGITIIKELS